ncbi:MAG: hypothetical protein Q4P72_02990 [Eubacteriales bacterium]|nr:hypothetical protein [Eubacteriales bacterium]
MLQLKDKRDILNISSIREKISPEDNLLRHRMMDFLIKEKKPYRVAPNLNRKWRNS